jgi:hypothetical protein
MKIIITEEQSKLLRGIVGEQSGDDELDLFMKRRSSLIDELIDKNIDEVEEEGTLFEDDYDFANNIINWVVQDMKVPDDIDEYEIINFIKDEFGDYILSRFDSEDDEDDDDNED